MTSNINFLQMGYDATYYVVFHVTRAALVFLQRDSYLYWPFLVSTGVVVLVIARISPNSASDFFSRKSWWHRSARADYRLYFLNALIFPAIASILLFGGSRIPAMLNTLIGLDAVSPLSPAAVTALRVLFTVCFFVAYDFGRFVAHCLMHDVRMLWEFHKVHHSAEVLTLITSYRVHPVELLIMAWIPALFTGLTAWLFNLAGAQVNVYTFLGLHVAIWGFSLVDNLRHSPVWLSYGSSVGRWLVSPAHHQLHHSCEPRHMGCNRGSNLAIWDRLYGTLYVPSGVPEKFKMGLGDEEESRWHGVMSMYCRPVVNCIGIVRGMLPGASEQRAPYVRSSPNVVPAVDESA